MKPIPLTAAALLLTGCASTETVVVESSAPEPRVDPESIEVAAVVELEPRSSVTPEVRCEHEAVVGSRIARQRCYRQLSGAEERLNEEMKRSEIEYARDMAMLEEQRRLEELTRRRREF